MKYAELLRLTEVTERLQAQRVACIADLARLRQTSAASPMKDLGLGQSNYA